MTPTPTHARVIVPLPEAPSVVTDAVPRRHAWHVDHINNAPDGATALRLMCEWARAEQAKCAKNRPEDAEAFAWQIIHALVPVVAVIYKSHPDSRFRARPKLPGGGWTPRRPTVRAAEARHP